MKRLLCLIWLLPNFASADIADAAGWGGSVELGYVSTGGNTDESKLKSKITLGYNADPWGYAFLAEGFNASSDGVRSAEKYFTSNRLTYSFAKDHYVFGYTGYEDNRFSGFDYQATVAAGYGRQLLPRIENMDWEAEIGPGFKITKVEDESQGEEDSKESIVRGFSKYRWEISDNAEFSQELSVEKGGDNTESRSITALQSTIVGNLAMKITYTVEYTENVPNDKKHADTETAITLAYRF